MAIAVRFDHTSHTTRAITHHPSLLVAAADSDVGGGNALDKVPYKLANISLRWMLKEIILSDCGIIFNRRKLMKFGVPGTEFAPKPVKIPAYGPGAPGFDGKKNANKKEMAPPTGKAPLQPTVFRYQKGDNDSSKKDESPATTSGEETEQDSGDSSSPTDGGDGTTVIDGEEEEREGEAGEQDEMIEVPWWYRDAIEPMRDELLHQPAWWLLELLPFYVKRQDEHSNWKKHLR